MRRWDQEGQVVESAGTFLSEWMSELGPDRVYDLVQKGLWAENVLGSPALDILRSLSQEPVRVIIDVEGTERTRSPQSARVVLGPSLARRVDPEYANALT